MEKIGSRIAKIHIAQENHALKKKQDPLEIIFKFAVLLLIVAKLVSGPRAMENG